MSERCSPDPSRRGNGPRIEEVSDPVDGFANESGGLLPGPGATLGGPTFEEWLDSGGRGAP